MQDTPTTDADADGPADVPASLTGRPSGRQVASVAAALALCLAAFVAMVMSGDATTEADRPSVTTLQGTKSGLGGYPFCTVETRPNGDGQLLAVSLLNDLEMVWAQVFFTDGTKDVLALPLDQGWAIANLPAEPAVQSVAVYGTETLIDYTAGCTWPPPPTETTTG